jgi:hypothetical protein
LPQPAHPASSANSVGTPVAPYTPQPAPAPYTGGTPVPSQLGVPRANDPSPQPSPSLAGGQPDSTHQSAALLDEEWVAKAKEAVARAGADPYLLSQNLAQIKAQYLKARYNKDVKTGKN